MNSQGQRFLRQASTFRPRLERLERRDCPSCTIFQKGETLFVVGDKSDNHIDIAGTREGGIAVSCDGGAPQMFAGVKQWDLKTLAGDDEITATFSAPGDSTFQFRADLGAGNDRLSVRGFDPQPDPPLLAVTFDILAGSGDDEITAILVCPSDPSFHFRADLGAGDDGLNIDWVAPPDSRPNPMGDVTWDMLGGAGNDAITARFTCPEDRSFHFRADLGAGDDRLNIDWQNPPDTRPDPTIGPPDGRPDPVGAVSWDLLAGAGNDFLDINWNNPPDTRPGDVHFRADLGAGDDRLNIHWVAPPGDRPDPVGAVSWDMLGGAGNDAITVRFTCPADRPFDFRADLGAGHDTFMMQLELSAVDGGITVGNPHIQLEVLGGAGDDDVTLAIHGLDSPTLLTALVDGGRGHDIARVTRNVRVVNCEEVIFLDEPR